MIKKMILKAIAKKRIAKKERSIGVDCINSLLVKARKMKNAPINLDLDGCF